MVGTDAPGERAILQLLQDDRTSLFTYEHTHTDATYCTHTHTRAQAVLRYGVASLLFPSPDAVSQDAAPGHLFTPHN